MGKLSLVNFTYLTIIACLLGVNFFSINLGVFLLSPYRILVILTLFLTSYIFKAYVRQRKSGADFGYIHFLIFWIIYSFIPLIWLNDYGAWAKSISFLFTGFISSLLIFGFLNDKNKIIKALEIITFISLLYSFLAFYEMFTGNYFFVTEQNIEYFQEFSLLYGATGFREPVTVFGNPNNYALFLFFTIVFAFLLFKIKITKRAKFYYLAIIIISIFLIICTQSRSGFIGACIFFFMYSLHAFLRRSIVFKFKALLVVFVLFILIAPTLAEYLGFFRDVATVEVGDAAQGSSDDIRKNLIKNGFVFLYQTLFLGVGLGNIEYYMAHNQIFDTSGIVNIHNWWMEVLVSSGLIVFTYYMVIYVRSMYGAFKVSKRSKDGRLKSAYSILLCFFIAFVVACIGASSLIDSEWLWSLMAIAIKTSTLKFPKMAEV